jgi:DNA-binding transcriptional regulator YiaG
MPNIATVLKAEIVRLARKELREQVDPLRKSLSASRAEVAALKRKVSELERQIRHASRVLPDVPAVPQAELSSAEDVSRFRFRAGGMASNRKRLGLSAADFGLLVGASGQSVYAWEQGKARPRGRNLAAIAALRGVGKRAVVERLAALKSGATS